MSATFTPYFEAQAYRDPTGSGAYIRVRVPDGPRPDGSILVYLPYGTGLVVTATSSCTSTQAQTGVVSRMAGLPPRGLP